MFEVSLEKFFGYFLVRIGGATECRLTHNVVPPTDGGEVNRLLRSAITSVITTNEFGGSNLEAFFEKFLLMVSVQNCIGEYTF
jgi:hypothetical protein